MVGALEGFDVCVASYGTEAATLMVEDLTAHIDKACKEFDMCRIDLNFSSFCLSSRTRNKVLAGETALFYIHPVEARLN